MNETRLDNSKVSHVMAYDGLDRLGSVTDGFGKQTQFSYYDTGLRRTMTDALGSTQNYTYDALNRTQRVSSPYGGAEFDYYPDDLPKTVYQPAQTGAQTSCAYTYDNAGRVTNVANRNVPGNSVISNYALAYDDGANAITLNETQGGQSETQVFQFGQYNRLMSAQ